VLVWMGSPCGGGEYVGVRVSSLGGGRFLLSIQGGGSDERREVGGESEGGKVKVLVKGVLLEEGKGRVWAGIGRGGKGGDEGVEGRFGEGVFNRDVRFGVDGVGAPVGGKVDVLRCSFQGRRVKGMEGDMEEGAKKDVLEIEDEGERMQARKFEETVKEETERILGWCDLCGGGDIQVEPNFKDVCWNLLSGSEGRWGVKARLNAVLRTYAAAWMLKALADESWRVCMKSKGRQTPENGVWMKRIFVMRAKMARWGEEVRSRYVEEVAGGWKEGENWEEEKVLWSSWWRSVESGITGVHMRDMQGLCTRLFVTLKEGGLEAVTTGEIERMEKRWEEIEPVWRRDWFKGGEGL
ncbi:hypothetical protein TrRE_jg813, partial [Triparma retinervis]